MKFFKKLVTFIFLYGLAVLTTFFVGELLFLIFKIYKITVQGPTTVSTVSGIVTHYITFSIAILFLFWSNGRKHLLKLKDIFLLSILVFIMHVFIIFFADWGTLFWRITLGTIELTILMYTGGSIWIASLREIPRLYYFIPFVIEDVCLIIFSLIGYSIRYKRSMKL